jgi:hypothetical protein
MEDVITININDKVVTTKLFSTAALRHVILCDNDDHIIKILESLIITKNLNRVEMFIALLHSYNKSINDKLELNIADNQYKFYITDTIKSLEDYLIRRDVIKVDIKGVRFELDLPLSLSSSEHMYIIRRIIHGDESVNVFEYSDEERSQLYSSLSIDIFNDIVSEITGNKHKWVVPIIDSSDILDVNIISGDINMLLVKIFKCMSIYDWREQLFSLSKRMNEQFILNSTLKDLQDYMQLYNRELSDEKGSDQGSQKLPNMGL